MYVRTSICMYKVPNRTYVRSRGHTVLVFVHRRCPYSRVRRGTCRGRRGARGGRRGRSARAELLVVEAELGTSRTVRARVTGRSQELAAVFKKKRS